MAELIVNIFIQGYWRERNKAGIPNHSGIYFVYETTYNEEEDTVRLDRLLYIGESNTVREMIANNELSAQWKELLIQGTELSYSTALVDPLNRERICAAFIFHYKPPINVDYKSFFTYDKTTVLCTGRTQLLASQFTIEKT